MAILPRTRTDRFELPTKPSLIARVKDLTDADNWQEFYQFYQPLLMRYLRHLDIPAGSGAIDFSEHWGAEVLRQPARCARRP